MKTCSKCKIFKQLNDFNKSKSGTFGHSAYCRSCSKIHNKQYTKTSKAKNSKKIRAAKYYQNLKLDPAKWQDRSIRLVTYVQNRKTKDIQFKLTFNLRCRLSSAIRGNIKVGSAIGDLGCSVAQLKEHLESKFQQGMTWENYGEWHIDHIKPLTLFDLTDRGQFMEACNYINLQPLWAKDNIQKSNKYINPGQNVPTA